MNKVKLQEIKHSLQWGIYEFFRKITAPLRKSGAAKKKLRKSKTGEFLFFLALIIYPVVQFCVFYIGVNFNSILLAFKTFNIDTSEFYFVGFDNFKQFFYDVGNDPVMIMAIKNSFKIYAVTLFIALPLNIFFSYFIYKKVPCSKFFQVILFMPQVLSAIVMSLMFKFFVDRGLPSILSALGFKNIPAFLVDKNTAFNTIMFYCVWSGFGTQILIYSSAMSRIDESLVEYAKLEGMSAFREFFQITLPLIFPTMITFLVAGIAGIFTNQAQVFNFYGSSADYYLQTLGYNFFIKVASGDASLPNYPYAAAGGVVFTVIAVPLTILIKRLLEKINPVTEY